MKKSFFLFIILASVTMSCKKNDEVTLSTFYGEKMATEITNFIKENSIERVFALPISKENSTFYYDKKSNVGKEFKFEGGFFFNGEEYYNMNLLVKYKPFIYKKSAIPWEGEDNIIILYFNYGD